MSLVARKQDFLHASNKGTDQPGNLLEREIIFKTARPDVTELK